MVLWGDVGRLEEVEVERAAKADCIPACVGSVMMALSDKTARSPKQ